MDLEQIIKVAEDYENGQVAMGRTVELDDINSPEEKKLYDDYIKSVNSIKTSVASCSSFSRMKKEQVFDDTLATCQCLFGDVIFNKDFFELLTSVTTVTNEQSPYEDMCLYALNPQTKKPSQMNILIPSLSISASSPALTHEYIHALLSFVDKDPIKKAHYVEILSILGEKAAIRHLIEQYPKLRKELRRLEECRIEAIKRHSSEVPQTLDELQKMLKLGFIPKEYAPMISRACNAQQRYSELLQNSYGIGYLYGNMLDYYAQDDPKTMQSKLIDICESGYTIPELLTYYGIDASKNEVYQQTERCLRKVRR